MVRELLSPMRLLGIQHTSTRRVLRRPQQRTASLRRLYTLR